MTKFLSIVFCALLLSGCIAKFNNISDQPEYMNVIGIEFATTKSLLIFGYTLEPSSNSVTDGYSITTEPGISGPEVLSRDILPVGTAFTIQSVERCSNCSPLLAYNIYVLKFRDLEKYHGVRVHFNQHIFDQRNELWK